MPAASRHSELLVDDGVEAEVEAGPAIGFGHLRAEQAGLAGFCPGLALDDAVRLMRVHARRDDVGQEAGGRCRGRRDVRR